MGYVSLIDGHIENAEHCVCCGQVIPEGSQYCIVCGMEKPKKQTNYDRIRNMSVEELAKFMMDIDYVGECPLPKERCKGRTCIECIKQWLESEVDYEN